MAQTVVLKSYKNGINLKLNSEISFEELLSDIIIKFKEAEGFFKDARIAISFEGRELSSQEEEQILAAISENTSVTILCVIDKSDEGNLGYRKVLSDTEKDQLINTGVFYRGSIPSGKIQEFESSVVILGNVECDAKVISKGNIVILGTLNGYAHAGVDGTSNAFVSANNIDPSKIQIGEVKGTVVDAKGSIFKKKKKKQEPEEPQVALVKENNIYVEPISKGLQNDL